MLSVVQTPKMIILNPSDLVAGSAKERGKNLDVATQFVFRLLIDSPPAHHGTVLITLIY